MKKGTMTSVLTLALMVGLVIFATQMAQPSFADDRANILGTWKLVSFEEELQATGKRELTLGKNPSGYIIFTPEGRFMTVLAGDGRKASKTDQDRSDLLKSMMAYTGMYRLEGDRFITKVDVSWNHIWTGTEQARFFRFDGGRLNIITAWTQSPTRPGLGMARGIMTFERAK
jgi:hypothetical protein